MTAGQDTGAGAGSGASVPASVANQGSFSDGHDLPGTPWRRSVWVWPSALTAALAVGVSLWGASFGAGAIAVLGAWVVWVFVRDLRQSSSWRVPVAAGMIAGVVLWVICSHQSAWIFTTHSGGASGGSGAVSSPPATGPTCSGQVQRTVTKQHVTQLATQVSGLPEGAQVTAEASTSGKTLASVVSYADGKGVALLSLTVDVDASAQIAVRADVRIGTNLVRQCVW